jgi:hypothetical protein
MQTHYSIFHPCFYEAARHGININEEVVTADHYFLKVVAFELSEIAKQFGCICRVSITEIETARQLWIRDTAALKVEGDGTPDHFKQAGILAYWLRRRAPLRNIATVLAYDTDVGRFRQQSFLHMSTELAAFNFGHNMCSFVEASHAAKRGEGSITYLYNTAPNFDFSHDISVLMKTKHISPHALMMIYRAMFTNKLKSLR